MLYLILFGCEEPESTDKAPVTYYQDVRPILAQYCVRCHRDGGQGPGDYLNPEAALPLAEAMMNSIDAGRMPPPSSDPSCHSYKGSDYLFLPAEDREIIRAWVEGGAELGDEALATEIEDLMMDVELEDPDLIVKITESYTPTFQDERNPGNEYRCFALEHGREEPFYITALHPIIDNSSLVHHVVLAKSKEGGIIEGSLDKEGSDCINDGAFISDFASGAMLGGWAPGMQPIHLEEGSGILVQPDEYIIVQMHYYQGDAEPNSSDQSGYAFKTTDQVEHTVQMFPIGSQSFSIPAGDPAYEYTSGVSLPFDLRIWGIFPHMHVLGSGYKVWIEHADGRKTCLAESDHYDFYNQIQYVFNNDEGLAKEDEIKVSCTWDNSAENPNLIHNPPIEIGYGERTDEEMCYAFTMISFD